MSEFAFVVSLIFIVSPLLTFISFRIYDMTTHDYIGWRPVFMQRMVCRELVRVELNSFMRYLPRSDVDLHYTIKGIARRLVLMNIDPSVVGDDEVCVKMITRVRELKS